MERLNLQLWLLHGHTGHADTVQSVDRTSLRLTRRRSMTCAEQLSLVLLDLVGAGRIPAGARLPTERAIAERMHLSRACVRSALDALKGKGFVKALQGSANRVPNLDEPGGTLVANLIDAHQQNGREFCRLRLSLDGQVARDAARNGSAAQATELLRTVRRSTPDTEETGSDAFYRTLVQASQNVIASRISECMSATIAAMEAGFDGVAREPGDAELRTRVAEAVAAQDDVAAEFWMRRYARRVAECHSEGGGRPEAAKTPGEILACLAPLRREPLPTTVSARMLELMRFGDLKPGDPLPSERILADALGISRVSVRSALQRLKAGNWITAVERDHTRVVSLPEAPDALTHHDHSARMIGSLFRVRSILECLSAEMAAEHAAGATFENIDALRRQMKRPGQTARQLIDLDIRFHQAIARLSGSGVNIFLGQVLADHLGPYFERGRRRDVWTGERDKRIVEQHDAVVAAIRAGDVAAASAAMSVHMWSFEQFYAVTPREEPEPETRMRKPVDQGLAHADL